ncbi:MAG: hypothetical protein AAF548_18855 [Actinomycetota bacterium]
MLRIAPFALAVGLLVAACGNDTSDDLSTDAPTSTSTTTATTDAPDVEAAVVTFQPLLEDWDDSLGTPPMLGDPGPDGMVEAATARFSDPGGWSIDLVLNDGSPGIDDFNELAAECVARSARCPTGRLAIAVDGEVLTAPNVEVASFQRDQITITGGFDEAEARGLADGINAGAS